MGALSLAYLAAIAGVVATVVASAADVEGANSEGIAMSQRRIDAYIQRVLPQCGKGAGGGAVAVVVMAAAKNN
eukprot:scaffold2004_cov63-Cyclotella_meneghiniana.AAC.3